MELMKKNKKKLSTSDQRNKLVKTLKKISRESRLEREKLVGKPRAKVFGGLPSAKELRRIEKKNLRNLDGWMG